MKKKILKTVALLLAAAMSLTLHAVNSITYTATYDLGNVNTGTDTLGGVTYTTVTYDGLFNDGNPGAPSLPIDYIRFSVPYNATNFSVNAVLRNSSVSNLPHLVYPCQTPRMMEDTLPSVITLPDSSIYYSGSFYPVNNAWVVDEGFLAGENHIVTVAVMPISFRRSGMGHLVTNQLKESPTVKLTLSYNLSDTLAIYPIIRKDSILRREGYNFTKGLVVNPDSVIAYAPPQSFSPSLSPQIALPDTLNNYADTVYYDYEVAPWASSPYLIVTTPELCHSMRRIAALKRQKGYGVRIVTMEDVLSNSYASVGDRVQRGTGFITTFTDNAGKLRQYLKMAFSNYGTRYVLFAGSHVPFRVCVFDAIPSDQYYSELHKDWFSSIDTISGFDLAVGRLLGTTPQQFSNYTDKLLRYELNPGGGDFAYLKKVFCSEGADFQYYNYFDNVNKEYEKLFNDSTHIKESITTGFPSGTDIINALNETKYGYISMENHAGPSGWIVNGYREEYNDRWPHYYLWAVDSIRYKSGNIIDTLDHHTGNGLNNLSNKTYPSILYSYGCSTAPFNTAPHYDSVKVCLGESFTMGMNYGGPAFLGHTHDGTLGDCMSQFEFNFINALNNGNCKIGIAEALSKLNTDKNLYADKKSHNLIGDPEFEVWTDQPSMITGVTVERADNSITVSWIAVDSMIVACYGNKGTVKKKIATTSPVTFNNVSPNSTIMLYKHNYIPYIVPMKLQNITMCRSQYVIASDVTAGEAIDNNRSNGNVTIPQGVEYEIEATGVVRLEDGFKVEKGATFAVYPSSF